ncbi:hypothetical protein RHSIM_RhsimUnG0052400 [Rhododendron simsii]|uniref:Uncharacterized protein n=1 Tax=Rhododendron simsii TaxID=118357 RepID=A0A834L5G2_RHOSS|nr:hypothetical protein RHSIM_RhsimUnG0052400 [Rhododendron simsii]
MVYTLLDDKAGRVEQLVAHIGGLDADVYGVRNPKYDKYYLTTHQHFDHLVDRLYDTEKWGNVLVKVSGNFEWGPINPLLDHSFPTRIRSAIERPYRIPQVRGFPSNGDKPDCSAPNKGLLVTGKWPNLIALLQCANRDAPTLLDYEPTYAGFAHRKDKSKLVRKTVDLATVAGQALQQQYQAQDLSSAGLLERKKQPDQVPISHPEQQEQPPARTEKTHSRRRRDSDSAAVGEDQRATKKGKTNKNVEILSEADPANRNEPSEAFLPDFECSDGHVISVDNSLGESPLLAMTLLRGLALPKDMENLPTGKANNMAELYLFLAKVCTIPTWSLKQLPLPNIKLFLLAGRVMCQQSLRRHGSSPGDQEVYEGGSACKKERGGSIRQPD